MVAARHEYPRAMIVSLRSVFLALVLGLASFPITVGAQQANQLLVVGILLVSAGPDDPVVRAIGQGLGELGYVEGHDFRFEFRGAEGHVDRLPRLAEELVQLKVDFIIVGTEAALLAAKRSTSAIPIVAALFDYDPVAAGLVDSLAHPGGNITGVFSRAPELIAKRLELLKEAVPSAPRMAVFYDSYARRQTKEIEIASHSLGIELTRIELKSPNDFKMACKTARRHKAGAAILLYSPAFFVARDAAARYALESRLPTMGYTSEFARAGFFLSYGTDGASTFKHLAYFIDRIVKGAKPSELPVEQPTKFEMIVNLRTAKALGISVPESILLRAD